MLVCFMKLTNKVETVLGGNYDSDYAADLDRRKSLTSYIFTVGGNVVS